MDQLGIFKHHFTTETTELFNMTNFKLFRLQVYCTFSVPLSFDSHHLVSEH